MKLSKLLGYIETSQHTPANTNEWQDHDEGYTCYTLFFEDLTIDIVSSYGSCSSGYCSASWGRMDKSDKKSDGFTLIKPKKDIFIDLDSNYFVEEDSREPWDAMVTKLISSNEELIAWDSGNGGCNYYPSGQASINKDLFES